MKRCLCIGFIDKRADVLFVAATPEQVAEYRVTCNDAAIRERVQPAISALAMPEDFRLGLEDYAAGQRFVKQGIDWASVEDERIGD